MPLSLCCRRSLSQYPCRVLSTATIILTFIPITVFLFPFMASFFMSYCNLVSCLAIFLRHLSILVTVFSLLQYIVLYSVNLALFGTFILRAHVPSIQISYYSAITLVSASSCCFILAVPMRGSCLGYAPRAWDIRSL